MFNFLNVDLEVMVVENFLGCYFFYILVVNMMNSIMSIYLVEWIVCFDE